MSTAHTRTIVDHLTKLANAFGAAEQLTGLQSLDLLLQAANASESDSPLDGACGAGVVAYHFARSVRATEGIDMTPAMLTKARDRHNRPTFARLGCHQTMDRRRLLVAVSLSMLDLGSMSVNAQASRKPLRIGFLSTGEPTDEFANALLQGLHDLGYRLGSDFILEGRGGQGSPGRYASLARELVNAKVDVIVAAGPAIDAVRRATSKIPVVMVGGAVDPVEAKLVASLSSPGGNITGLTLQQADLVAKRLELLKEVRPGSAPIGILWEETSIGSWKAAQSAAAARGWQLLPFEILDREGIGPACARARSAGAASLLVISGGLLFENTPEVIQAAAANGLPAMYALRRFADQGGFMSYGADLVDLYRRAAAFVDRIAKGMSPAVMPIEQPTKFELVINAKAAKALGVTIPQSLLLRADEVIQ
jgi:putative ABC transport system substrate-binding protein